MDVTERVLPLATLRTCTFTVLLAAILHARGDLAPALERSSTSFGIAAFAVLWATTWVSTRYGERQIRLRAESPVDAVGWTIVAGGFNGALVWCAIVLGVVLSIFVRAGTPGNPPMPLLSVPPVLMIALPIGGIVAYAAGAVIGAVYGMVELVLDAGSRRLWRFVAAPCPDDRRAVASWERSRSRAGGSRFTDG
jgi:hypothetical protein